MHENGKIWMKTCHAQVKNVFGIVILTNTVRYILPIVFNLKLLNLK